MTQEVRQKFLEFIPLKTIRVKVAALTHDVEVMDEASLKQFIKAVRSFFNAFEAADFNDLSEKHIQKLIDDNKLTVTDLINGYTKTPRKSQG